MAKIYHHSPVEKKWQREWERRRLFSIDDSAKAVGSKKYVLDMFPYPSAQGLHVGHPEGYTASDIMCRYLRMKGKAVLHPMGFDAFGLPAENYAIKTGTHPAVTTAKNIKNMRKQIQSLGFSYDWDREVVTSDPKYYRWTQWIFVQLFKHGLAYEAFAPINWCPSCKTGLANEEVVNGKCERCGTVVTKKQIKQWLVKITDERYVERLLHGLDKLDWPENIKLLQKNWIGRSEGALVNFELWTKNREQRAENSQWVAGLKSKVQCLESDVIEVFTTRPDTLFGATYIVLSPEHPLVNDITSPEQRSIVGKYQIEATRKSDLDRTDLAKEKTGVFTGAYAINPANDKKIPIWIADYVLSSYGTGAIMAVPAHDERDFEFAKKFKLPIVKVIDPPSPPTPLPKGAREGCYSGDGKMVNSGQYDGMDSVKFKDVIIKQLNSKAGQTENTCLVVHGIGGHKRENWFPWLKEELARYGWETIVPTMPGEGHPTLESWNDFLRHYDTQVNESSVLVGHSLGCASILYYLQESGKKVDTVIFVAPTNPLQDWEKLKKEYPDYDWGSVERMNQTQNLNWEKIRTLANRFIIVHSENDPYIPVDSMVYYKKNLPEAEIHLIPGKYHFSEAKGIKSIPEILPFFPKRKAGISVNYKLRDWLFSRQRYWGEPIPIVHCDECAKKYKQTFVVVHGIFGHSKENWLPWFRETLEKLGHTVLTPDLPNADRPRLEEWLDELRKLKPLLGDNVVFIGHSLAAPVICKFIERESIKVKKLFLIAPTGKGQKRDALKKIGLAENSINDIFSINETVIDWKKVKELAKHAFIYFSDNDPYIPLEVKKTYQPLGADVRIFSGKGHFNAPAGVLEFPEILNDIKPMPVGLVPVPVEDLPLELPNVKKYEPTGTGESPLASIDKWVNTKCPQCGGKAKRETNTMPQWAGSNWYFLRYCDPKNEKQLADPEKLKQWLPVDLYVGGAEHAVLHLLYARFIYKFLFDIGVVPKECGDEPFLKLKNQGLILGEDNQKMSKSRGNVVNPDDVIKKFGADAMRMYEMFMGPFEDAKPWNTNGIVGMTRFLERIWQWGNTIASLLAKGDKRVLVQNEGRKQILHKTIKKVTEDIENFRFNTAISQLMIFFKDVTVQGKVLTAEFLVAKDEIEIFLKLLSPFAPHLAAELWEKLGHQDLIDSEPWPVADEKRLIEKEISIPVQINGKVRDQLTFPTEANEEEVLRLALASDKVKKWLDGKRPKMAKYIKGRIVTIAV
ncbi:MAG: alpha/beta fold hydrolase [Patescibacteria group bacterium]